MAKTFIDSNIIVYANDRRDTGVTGNTPNLAGALHRLGRSATAI